ncbi:MAG: hypothetical protein J4G12_07550 [Gemmatimonadetes bacterium]|nr:hypothetical protein [Gemmatimonadota bacterium]
MTLRRSRGSPATPTVLGLGAPILVTAGLTLASCGSDPPPTQPPPVDTTAVRPVPCTTGTATCAERIEIAGGLFLPIFSSHELATGDASVTRAVIAVHGIDRNADDYFVTGNVAAAAARAGATAVIVAPHFQTSDDAPESDEPFWSSAGWRKGHLSRPEGPSPRVSSYLAMDRLIETLANRSLFPQIATIVLTGHSAGGQFVHRFAATSPVEDVSVPSARVRYVVANPSTYLYLRPERWQRTEFAVPDRTLCSDYNEWHYGLEERPSRVEGLEIDTVQARTLRRDVTILIGSADSTSSNLDVSCGANLQGRHRFERGELLVRFMNEFFDAHSHRELVVPGVGHSSRDMWTSSVGLGALFQDPAGYGASAEYRKSLDTRN